MKQPILFADYFMNRTFIKLAEPLDIYDGDLVHINEKNTKFLTHIPAEMIFKMAGLTMSTEK